MSVDFGAEAVVGGTTLIIPAIGSPNYVLNTTGWIINADGSAQFNSITFGMASLLIDNEGTIQGFGTNGVTTFTFASLDDYSVWYLTTARAFRGSPSSLSPVTGPRISSGM